MKNKIQKAIQEKKPVEYQVPKKGSLGLLAAGHKGIRAWRKAMSEKDKFKTK